MKKLLSILFVSVILIASITACRRQNTEDTNSTSSPQNMPEAGLSVAIFRGVIEEVTGTTATVRPNESEEHILSSGDKVSVDLSVSTGDFSVGDEIVVYYTGTVMESYPLQIHTTDVELAEDFDSAMQEGNENSDGSLIEISSLIPSLKIGLGQPPNLI